MLFQDTLFVTTLIGILSLLSFLWPHFPAKNSKIEKQSYNCLEYKVLPSRKLWAQTDKNGKCHSYSAVSGVPLARREGNLCMYKCTYHKRCLNFVISAKEKLQNAPRFERDLCWILPCAHPILIAFRLTSYFFNKKFSRNNFSVYCFEFAYS